MLINLRDSNVANQFTIYIYLLRTHCMSTDQYKMSLLIINQGVWLVQRVSTELYYKQKKKPLRPSKILVVPVI